MFRHFFLFLYTLGILLSSTLAWGQILEYDVSEMKPRGGLPRGGIGLESPEIFTDPSAPRLQEPTPLPLTRMGKGESVKNETFKDEQGGFISRLSSETHFSFSEKVDIIESSETSLDWSSLDSLGIDDCSQLPEMKIYDLAAPFLQDAPLSIEEGENIHRLWKMSRACLSGESLATFGGGSANVNAKDPFCVFYSHREQRLALSLAESEEEKELTEKVYEYLFSCRTS